MKYVFLNALPNTQEVYRTKQGVLTCKVNNARAPLVWYRAGKPIDVYFYKIIFKFLNFFLAMTNGI